jgi:hypothetical protein
MEVLFGTSFFAVRALACMTLVDTQRIDARFNALSSLILSALLDDSLDLNAVVSLMF